MRSLTCWTPSSPRSVTMSVAPYSQGELLPWLVAAHRDDPFGAELFGGEHAEQSDRAIADHGDRLARPGVGGGGGEPAGPQHVGGGEQTRDQIVGGDVGGGDEGAIGERYSHSLGLRAAGRGGLAVKTGGLITGPADFASVVGREERTDDELAGPDRGDRGPDLLHDSGVLVSHPSRLVHRFDSPVGPQVRSADAGRGGTDDRIRGRDNRRLRPVLDTDISGAIHDSDTHRELSLDWCGRDQD